MVAEQILTNARVVTDDAVIDGTVVVRGGTIVAVDEGRARGRAAALDLDGDFLLPGLIDVHTDNLETHLEPRPGVRWPGLTALMTHDRQMVSAGVTTTFDALCVGDANHGRRQRSDALRRALAVVGQARDGGMLKAEHFLHLRCEVTAEGVVDAFARLIDDPLVRLVSVMDHTPGQRQWANLDKWRKYNERFALSDAEQEQIREERQRAQVERGPDSRRSIVAMVKARRLPLASHDDTTAEHVTEAADDGVVISEFPTTLAAARLARARRMTIVMGAPNVVLGGSQSGNVSAAELFAAGLIDALASDYVPVSLIEACFTLSGRLGAPLAGAVATVSARPAAVVGLADRGRIAAGLKADLVRVAVCEGAPVVRTVWRDGIAVA